MSRALSPRQRDVVGLLLEGLSNQEIGERLGMTTRTVKAHLNRMYVQFDISSAYIKRVRLAYLLHKGGCR